MTENQACLELETIAALVDGTISRGERSRLERHLASCEECCTVLAEAIRERDERPGRSVTRLAAQRAVWAVGGLAAAILVGVVVWPFLERRIEGEGPVFRGVGPLTSVAADRRSVDARITGGFPWVPLKPLERSGAGPRTTPAWEILAAASQIRKEAEADPSPENRHALGVAHLVLGNVDEAVTVLRGVSGDSPANATLLNDLGAALLARGEIQARPDDLIEALSCIERALESNKSLKEALFNRAVALEKLHLDDKAAKAWEEYLSREPEPGWADEARQRLEALREAKESGSWDRDRDRIEKAIASASSSAVEEIVARRTQETRLWVQDALLGAWARAAKDGRAADAASALATATTIAEALEATTADPLTRQIVAVVRETGDRGPSGRLDALIRGHLAYQSGVEHFDRFEIGVAQPFFVEAQDALASAGSPQALWASFGVARCEYYRGTFGPASRRLDLILAEAESKSYLALGAHTNWLRGLLDLVQNRLDGSLARYQRGLAAFERLREVEHSAFVCSLVAENLGLLGDERESLRKILDALSRINRVRSPGRVVVILLQAAIAASRQGFPDVALEFANAAVETAKQGGDAIDIADSLQRRAMIASEFGRLDAARSDLAAAREWVPRIADSAMRGRIDAEVRSADCRLVGRGGNPAQSEVVLTEAIGFFSRSGYELRLPELYLERARASRAQGDMDATERDLKAAIEIFERHRLEILGQTLRVSYFDTAHELFDELVSLEIGRGRPDVALAYLERGKTRDLLDRWRTATPLAVDQLRDAIPEGVAVIAYGVLPDRLLVWTLSHGSRELTEESITARDLTQLVKKFRDELESASAEAPTASATRLYEVLINPVAQRLAGFGTVVVIPDEILHAVPFAALADATTNRFLVEDHPIVVAPSIALFLQATNSQSAKATRVPPTLLAIGDPAFDAAAFPYLPRLSGAAAEAKRIARFYSDAVVLTGAAASPHRFLSELGRQTVVHVASHALTNESDPLRSRLLLAPDPEHQDSGTLFAEDLYGKSFGQVRLVVLAACSTASGRISRGEGPLSLARPFLAGGVPAVLATMWEIEDAPSSELLTAFHRQIAAGRPPEEALRDAQVALIEGNDPALRAPRSWAAFQIAGGVDRTNHS